MEAKESIITTSGVSKIEVAPDQLDIRVTSESSYTTNEAANNALLGDIKQINDILNQLNMNDVKAEISRSKVTKSTRDIHDKYKNVIGEEVYFTAWLTFNISMDINHPSSETLFKLIGKKLKNAEINVSYKLKNTSQHTLKALAQAVQEAKSKAEVITNTCDYQLGKIVKITDNCSCEQGNLDIDSFFGNRFSGFSCGSNSCASNNRSEPSKAVVSATVDIIWNIERKNK